MTSHLDNTDEDKIHIFHLTNRLLRKLGIEEQSKKRGFIAEASIAEADRMIEKMRDKCPDVISEYWHDLMQLWEEMKTLTKGEERDRLAGQIFTMAHEIKDMATLGGMDLVAYFAESLRDFIDQTELNMKAQRVIIQAHIDAIQVIMTNNIQDGESAEAEELKGMVKIAIEKYK